MWARGLLSLLIREPDGPILAAVGRLADAARGEHLRKMRGLYVDYAAGSVLLPADITAAEPHELISDVQAVLGVAMEAWCHEAVRGRLRDLQQHLGEFNSMMASALQVLQADPDAAVAITRQLLNEDGRTADSESALSQSAQLSYVAPGRAGPPCPLHRLGDDVRLVRRPLPKPLREHRHWSAMAVPAIPPGRWSAPTPRRLHHR